MNEWSSLGKLFIMFGIFAVIIGLFMLGMGKVFNIGRLPGDIYYQKGNFTFYFPLASSILLSIILTIILNLLLRR